MLAGPSAIGSDASFDFISPESQNRELRCNKTTSKTQCQRAHHQITEKSANKESLAKNKANKAPPHTWTHNQKANLLEGIAKCISKGLATDNGNNNKIEWSLLMERIKSQFQLSLTIR
ncbi:hypothetical protein VP01_2961g1 [Puccinia sorghi]|uniref:Myb/SANT-like domain-containing protein n=1 Tax=Puccinia sorghi TaxID=27349 RepID=A0A0L6V0V4_9BASI|nr:hypothetical protein VP01_2961g1 [Puccinia sorghi]